MANIKLFCVLFIVFLSVSSCDPFESIMTPKEQILKEGEQLSSTHYSQTQPTKLEEYKQFATMIIPGGIAVIKPDSIPVLIKTINVKLICYYAQIDTNGLIWLAAIDDLNHIPNQHIYQINPLTEKIHKVIRLPDELRAPTCLAFNKDKVFVVSTGSGRSVGLGSIDRTDFSVQVLATIDSVGTPLPPGLELINNNLYIFGTWCSVTDDRKIIKFNLPTNKTTQVALYSGYYTFDDKYLFTNGYFSPGIATFYKLSLDSLNVLNQINIEEDYVICNDENYIYAATWSNYSFINVYSKETLEKVKEIDISNQTITRTRYTNNNFAFITKELIMLNEKSFYNTKTDKILNNIFPLDFALVQNLVLAEGQTLKSFSN